MDREAWQATVLRVTKSQILLKWQHSCSNIFSLFISTRLLLLDLQSMFRCSEMLWSPSWDTAFLYLQFLCSFPSGDKFLDLFSHSPFSYSSHFLLHCFKYDLSQNFENNLPKSKLLELVMEREAWRAAIHKVAKSWTWLSDWTELNWSEESLNDILAGMNYFVCVSCLV